MYRCICDDFSRFVGHLVAAAVTEVRNGSKGNKSNTDSKNGNDHDTSFNFSESHRGFAFFKVAAFPAVFVSVVSALARVKFTAVAALFGSRHFLCGINASLIRFNKKNKVAMLLCCVM